MSFLLLLFAGTALALLPQIVLAPRLDLRRAMRHGLALALLFTGIDHFAHAGLRYLPMMPAFFGATALPLVWLTGAAELIGAFAFLTPTRVANAVGLPRLHRAAGIGLAVLFGVMVIANINMAIRGTDVVGLEFGQTYLTLRPFLQPVFIGWALYAGGVIGRRVLADRSAAADPAPAGRISRHG